MTNTHLLDAITNGYITSAKNGYFNGIVASTLLEGPANAADLRSEIGVLIQSAQVTAVFSCHSLNIHIKRLPDLPIDEQLRSLTTEPLESFCLYPSASIIHARFDLSTWQDRPFSKALLLAEPQLAFRAFDLGVLERYTSDPRYIVHFKDYMGQISIADEYFADTQYPERDKVSLQTFGLGLDKKHAPYVIVFLRYLTQLSSEHQQYWNSYLAADDVRMCEPYFRSSIEGQFWINRSVRNAIIEEMSLIRTLSEAIWGRSLFRAMPDSDIPIGLSSFLRPTAENFDRFVMALDKLLSESIDERFFGGKVALEIESPRLDGKVAVQKKGTLSLLEEWLLEEVEWEDPAAFSKVIIRPLREVRKLRQKPAHSFKKDNYSAEYRDERKRLLWDVFNSLSNIRATFKKHPRASQIKVPNWLNDTQIDVF